MSRCTTGRNIVKVVMYSTIFVALIDAIILLILSFINILRKILGDGFSLSLLIFIGLLIIYGLYIFSRRILNL
ncbi:MAG: hypothetical protein QXT53_01535 [Ignisphaera sp.]